jgi:WD40 repeat protein
MSPDGRFLLADVSASEWRLAVSGQTDPSASALADLGLNQSPILPVRDAALAQIIAHWNTDSSGQPVEDDVPINWSPDGRYLATPTGQSALTVYDCASGQQITTLQDQPTGLSFVSGVSGVAWSPDSKRLLYWDGTSGAVRIAGLGK